MQTIDELDTTVDLADFLGSTSYLDIVHKAESLRDEITDELESFENDYHVQES